MSALCQKQTFCAAAKNVAIRSPRRREYGEARRFGSLEIDYKLVLRGRLYGKIGWLRTLENAIDIDGGARRIFRRIRPVRGKAATRSVKSQPVNARHAIPDCQHSNQLGMTG